MTLGEKQHRIFCFGVMDDHQSATCRRPGHIHNPHEIVHENVHLLLDAENNIRIHKCRACSYGYFVFREDLHRHQEEQHGRQKNFVFVAEVDRSPTKADEDKNLLQEVANEITEEDKSPMLSCGKTDSLLKMGSCKSKRKTKAKVQKPITNCNLCSEILDVPVVAASLRDGNKVYPATCPSCETKFCEMNLHITIRTAYLNEKIYKCGLCSTPHKAQAQAMRHLRVHVKDQPYEMKSSKDFYVVKVVTKTACLVKQAQIKLEPAEASSSRRNVRKTATTGSLTASSKSKDSSDQPKTILRTSGSAKIAPSPTASRSRKGRLQSKSKVPATDASDDTVILFHCRHAGCGKQFKTKRSLRAHSGAHSLNISALWGKKMTGNN